MNEIGPITGETALSVAENISGSLATYQAEDPEEDAVSWSLSGSDATLFQIDESGTLSLNDALDFEAPASAAGTNDYSLSVVATDDNRRPVSLELPVTVSGHQRQRRANQYSEDPPMVEPTSGDPTAILNLNEFFTDPDGDSPDLRHRFRRRVRRSLSRSGGRHPVHYPKRGRNGILRGNGC